MTNAKRALRFVALMGVVNLFADFTYEGGRGVAGAFLGHLGANGAVVGIVAGAGELAGYAIRLLSGFIADRTGLYWIDMWVGYVINLLCVPALALAGSWPAAAGLLIGERIGRGVRKPMTAALLSHAARTLGGGRVFGFNEALDQIGATLGPIAVAVAIAHGGFRVGFGMLIVPALLTLGALSLATIAGKQIVPDRMDDGGPIVKHWPTFRRYATGGALVAAGYVDFALIAFHFSRDGVMPVPAISIAFAVAMAVGAISAPVLGRLFDRFGRPIIVLALALTAAATPLVFLGRGALAEAGVALWGVGSAVQDALLLALIAGLLAQKRRATAFGLYDLVFGVAWFAGSAIAGVLVDRSIAGLVIFSMLLQLCAIPFFAWPSGRDRTPACA